MAHPGGRPIVHKAENVLPALNKYIDETEQPFIQEFCLNYRIDDETLSKLADTNKEIFDAKKRLLRKQELFLIREGSANRINPTMAIFRLKQPVFGYTDKQEFKVDANVSFSGDDKLDD